MATLAKERQVEIDAIIDDVKLKTGFAYPGGNLLDLADRVAVKVYLADLSEVDPDLSGIIKYDDDELKTNPRIYVSTHIPENRQRFTLAHELGHHFLHRGRKMRLDNLNYAQDTEDVLEESEANYFAASFLVPKVYLLRQLEEQHDLKRMATTFGVSEAVIENRIRWIATND